MTTSINAGTLNQSLPLNALDGSSSATASTDGTNASSSADFSGLFQSLLQYIESGSPDSDGGLPVSSSGTDSAFTDILWTLLSSSTPSANLQSSQSSGVTPGEQVSQTPAHSSADNLTSDSSYSNLINQMAAKYAVDPSLIRSIVETESGGNSQAVSKAGAEGLMQLMPSTARALGVSDSFDPAQNIEGGTKYIKSLLKTFNGNVRLAVAAYNSGSANVRKYGDVPPFPETQAYVAKVMNKMGQGTATV